MVGIISNMGIGVTYPEDFCPGMNFQCGHHVVIEPGVTIGNNVKIGNFVLLKSGTTLEDDVFIDSYCISSGQNLVGAGSKIRYQSIIARNVIIGKNVFFCAGVKTAYLDHKRNDSSKALLIGDNCFIGDNATLLSKLTLAEGIVVGAHALVTRNLEVPWSVYAGCPAKFMRELQKEEIDAVRDNIRG